ncbi:MAG: ABC transporter substrate-binding protein [Gammaproteobacteria bacterium]|nr:ABC transporter substrate-binding protein [Gammaproteobacteria bacterium]
MKKSLAVLVSILITFSGTALSDEKAPIKYGLTLDYTKSYVFATPSVSQAIEDYRNYLNARGGINGHKLEILNSDHGNEPQRGIEAYERKKREGAIVFEHFSTPVSKAVLPKAMKDKNVMLQTLTGRSDAADGEAFPYAFPIAPTYWAMAANIIQYIENNTKDIKKAKIAFTYLDFPFGQEPIPVLQELQKQLGFELKLFPIALPGTDQSGVWSGIRRFKPDYVVAWSFSALHNIALTEMTRNRIPLEKYISVVWASRLDLKSFGYERAKGVKRVEAVATGTEIPIIQEILKAYDAGKGAGPRENVGTIYYMGGIAEMSILTEGAKLALNEFGAPLTGEKLKKGLEMIRDFDANGLMAPVTITSSDHQGGGKTRISEWDGEKWAPVTDWEAAHEELVWKTIKEHSAKFTKENQ